MIGVRHAGRGQYTTTTFAEVAAAAAAAAVAAGDVVAAGVEVGGFVFWSLLTALSPPNSDLSAASNAYDSYRVQSSALIIVRTIERLICLTVQPTTGQIKSLVCETRFSRIRPLK